jgi:hypothetical protein
MMTKFAWWTVSGLLAGCVALAGVLQTAPPNAPASPGAGERVAPQPEKTMARTTHVDATRPSADASNRQPLHAVELAVQRARAAGAGEDEVYRLRAEALPAQTIAMLTEREQAEQQWMRRIAAWHAERAKLDPGDAAALQALRARMFDADEQIRVDAYEPSRAPRLILPAH